MPIKVLGATERKQRMGVVVCRTHGPCCKKHPDHPAVQERKRRNDELSKDLVEMAWTGHLLARLKELADAGYTVPEEFTRGNEDPPKDHRVRLFFERYDLGKHFPPEEPETSNECKTRKLSDDELRQRREWAAEVRAARQKKGLPDPTPPWEKSFDAELARLIADSRPEFERQQKAEKAERVSQLKADEELARKMREALATWVNSPPRNRRHIQDVREGYGDAVPEFEEE